MIAWFLKATLVAVLLDLGAARASDDFYAGKVINLVIGTPVGGGYDTSARLVARHLGNHIAGNPVVVPRNMPGASGAKAANYMANIAPRDGTTLALFHEYVPLEQMLEGEGIEFDATKFGWIGRVTSTEIVYFVWHTSPSSSFARVRERETILGGTSGRGLMEYLPRVMNGFAGAKFKVVSGYSGSRNVLLAMERGELEAGFALWSQLKFQQAEQLRDGKIKVIISITEKRLPDLPDVPSLIEVITDSQKKPLFKHLTLTAQIGHSVMTAPGVPSERVAVLREAFTKMLADPAFLADANKAGVLVDPARGEQVQKIVEDLLNVTPEARLELRKAAGLVQ